MNCTECNRPVRPVAAIDIDGTLARYHVHFLTFAQSYFGTPFNLQYDGSVKLAHWMNITDESYRACKLAYRLGGMKRMMPSFGAKGEISLFISRLREHMEVWITTTRPYLRLDNTDPDTREWLRRNAVTCDGLLYDEDKYAKLVDIVGQGRIIGVLDDLPENYDRAEFLGLHPMLIQREHNRLTRDRRATEAPSLHVAERMLLERAKRWEGQHA